MARIRTIKPDFFKNETVADLPAMIRLLFIGLWTQSDREGKLEDRPRRIKVELFPYDNIDIDKSLNVLQDAGLILRYKVNANGNARILAPEQPNNQVGYIKIITFCIHQQPNIKEAQSIIPDPPILSEFFEHCASTVQAQQERKGTGREGNGEQEGESVEHLINFSFDDFWNAYEKKVGKIEKLKKKWNELSEKDRQKIMDYIPLYIQSQPEKQFRKNPETFLNNKSWNDEIIFKEKSSAKKESEIPVLLSSQKRHDEQRNDYL